MLLHLDTRGDEGRIVAWTIETMSPQGLSRAGLTLESFKVGEVLSAGVCVAKGGAHWAVTHEIARPGGAALEAMRVFGAL